MKKIKKIPAAFLFVIMFMSEAGLSQDLTFFTGTATPIEFYISKESNESSSHSGAETWTTLKCEHTLSPVDITLSDPSLLDITIDPELSIGPEETITWTGSIIPSVPDGPEPGTSVFVDLTVDWDFEYCKPIEFPYPILPFETGSNGTFDCEGGCYYHDPDNLGLTGTHRKVRSKYTFFEAGVFAIHSINVEVPEVACLEENPAIVLNGVTSAGYEATVTAITYPALPGEVTWSTTDPALQIVDQGNKTAKVYFISATPPAAEMEATATFTIENVSYSKPFKVNTCECQCKEITAGETFGPLNVSFSSPPVNTEPNADGDCEYDVANASFDLAMKGVVEKTFSITGANVKYKKNCESGEIKDVTITWTGDEDIGEIKYFGAKVKGISLSVDNAGNLSGHVDMNACLNSDYDLLGKGVFLLRSGVNGDFTFNFSGGNSFGGNFDFNGVQDINIDIVKDEQIIAQFQNGSFNSNEVIGTFSALAGISYQTNGFTVALNTLAVDLNISLDDGFRLTGGAGSFTVSNIAGTSGEITCSLTVTPSGDFEAEVAASNLTAFSMTLEQFNLVYSFDSNFDMIKMEGSLKAKHNKFDVALDVPVFVIEEGKIQEFKVYGTVNYNAFKFELIESSYSASTGDLVISAKVELNVTGAAMSLSVEEYKIDASGMVTVGKIEGDLDKPPVTAHFDASMTSTEFHGNFNASISSMGMKGTIIIGAQTNFNYGYFKLTAETNIVMGQTGLKLTEIGGEIGYNYQLTPSPAPAQGTYIAGLTVGIADVAGMCEVIANPVIQLNSSSVTFTLNGTINVLQNNTFFSGNLNMNYKVPDQTFWGSVGVNISVPQNGKFFKSNNLSVDFSMANKNWTVDGYNMGGKLFNFIDLMNGEVHFHGNVNNPTVIYGNVKGEADGHFNYFFDYDGTFNHITFNSYVKIYSSINAQINKNGLNGAFGVKLKASGMLTWQIFPFQSGSLTVIATFIAQVTYNSGIFHMQGQCYVNIPEFGEEIGLDFSKDITI